MRPHSDQDPVADRANFDGANSDGPRVDGADPRDIAVFDAAAERWWDPHGPMAALHGMQPVRLDYARDQLLAELGPSADRARPLAGRRLVDLGCGAGLASEPMARLGAEVTGVDASAPALAAARAHAAAQELAIDYVLGGAEDLASAVTAGARPAFDAALALEVVEHLPDRDAFLAAAARLLRPGGVAVISTLNRTARSFALGIVAAERLLGMAPPGTHEWRRFVTPDELATSLRRAGLTPLDQTGLVFSPLTRHWRRSARDLSINYVMTAVKPPS